MTVPFVDLHAQYLTIKSDIDAAVADTIARSAFIGGDALQALESEFAGYCEAAACVGVGNGTDAIYLTLRALGIGSGDEVITVSHTFIATAEAVSMTGATPVFVEIDEATMLMDPDAVEAAITPRTRAIVPVHLYGQSCDMDRIMAVAKRRNLLVVEDAAQAHGARWRGRRVGSIGDAGCFSFFPGKNLGAYGDAGGVVSNDKDLVKRVRMLANHGRKEKYTHERLGVNSRLDGLQAAILRVKLRHLDAWNAARRAVAGQYAELLRDSGVRLPVISSEAEAVWHLFVVRTADRDQLLARLKAKGISGGVHYPVPLHQQPAYAHLQIPAGTLPITERAAATVASLPMYPEMTREQVEAVCQAVTESVAVGTRA